MDPKPPTHPLAYTLLCSAFTVLSFTVGRSNALLRGGFLMAALLFGFAGVALALKGERQKAGS